MASKTKTPALMCTSHLPALEPQLLLHGSLPAFLTQSHCFFRGLSLASAASFAVWGFAQQMQNQSRIDRSGLAHCAMHRSVGPGIYFAALSSHVTVAILLLSGAPLHGA